jgi:hypothetical protein
VSQHVLPENYTSSFDIKTWEKVLRYCDLIVKHKIDITDKGITGWGKLLFAIARTAPDEKPFRLLAHDISQFFDNGRHKYSKKETDYHCDKIWAKKDLPHPQKTASIASFFEACKDYGIIIKKDEIDLPEAYRLNETMVEPPKAPIFPLYVVPEEIKDLLLAISRKMGISINYLASSFLVAAAGSLDKKLILKTTNGYSAIPVLFLMIVGPPGNNKSIAPSLMLQPFKEQTSRNIKFYKNMQAEYKNQKENKGAKAPDKPEHLIITDTTLEGLNKILDQQRRGLIIYRDELTGWAKDFDKYRNKGSDLNDWLSIFQGESVVRTRATEESIVIEKPVISVIGTIQIHRLHEIFRSAKDSSGLLSRFLFAFDNLPHVPWGSGNADKEWKNIHNIIDEMIDANPIGGYMRILQDADIVFRQWNNSLVKYRKENMNDWEMEASKKWDIYVFRFALILHWIWNYKNPIIPLSKEIAEKAVDLVNFFDACREIVIGRIQTLVGEKMPADVKKILSEAKISNDKLSRSHAIYLAREKNITDSAIAEVLNLSREWVNRLYNEYKKNHIRT